MRIGLPAGQRSPSSTRRTSTQVGSKSRPGSTPVTCRSGLLAPATRPRRPLSASSASTSTGVPSGPMKPGSAPNSLRTSSASAGPERRSERVLELDLVEAMVAADHDQHGPALLHDHRERLDDGPGRDAERLADGVHRRGSRASPPRVAPARARAAPPPAAQSRSRSRRSRRSPSRTAPRRSRRPRRAPCTRARRCRPSFPRRSPRGTTRARCGRRCGRRPRCGARRRRRARPASRSNEYASFMMNSRVRSSPARGRGSSRSFVWKW